MGGGGPASKPTTHRGARGHPPSVQGGDPSPWQGEGGRGKKPWVIYIYIYIYIYTLNEPLNYEGPCTPIYICIYIYIYIYIYI